MTIRRLVPADAAAVQSLRLAALRESPAAFSSSYEEEREMPLAAIERHLGPESGRTMFGAFAGPELVGMVGVGREHERKIIHKAFVRSMYVAPAHRGKGLGRRLLQEALSLASSMKGLRQVMLSVTADNEDAVALYQSAGFTVFGREPDALLADDVLHDEMHMVLHIASRSARQAIPMIAQRDASSALLPDGWQTITPRIAVRDAERLVAFLRQVFRATGEYRSARPSVVRIGDSTLMISEVGIRKSMTAFLYVYVDDADVVYRRALAAGATSLEEPSVMPYGDRRCMVEDPWNNTWQIATRAG